jgi:hypothetical protein
VKIVERRSGNITGMGIRYGTDGLAGSRLFDFELIQDGKKRRIYSLLNYSKHTLLLFGDAMRSPVLPEWVQCLQISGRKEDGAVWAETPPYENVAILVRPDGYIEAALTSEEMERQLSERFYG